MDYDVVSEMLEHLEADTERVKAEKPVRDYIGFYGLEKDPFRDSIDTGFFYRTHSHEEAYMRMMFTVEHDVSLGMVYSRSGMGKTLLSQMILTNLDESKYNARLVLVTPKMSRTALVWEIASEIGILDSDAHFSLQQMITGIQCYAIELYKQNKKLVLFFDEAHFLSADALHIIRTLSNIEVPEKKLVTCLLFAERSLVKRLERESYSSIRSRLYHCFELQPLGENEVAQMIKYRILMSGGSEAIFTPEAYKHIYEKSEGICRRVNKTCTLALFDGYITGTNPIGSELIDEIQ